jgi:hypothetical protein
VDVLQQVRAPVEAPLGGVLRFETYQKKTTGGDDARQKGVGPTSSVDRRNTGVASFAYCVVSDVPDIPTFVHLDRADSTTFLEDMVELGLRYRSIANNPVPIIMTEQDKAEFEGAVECYLCRRPGVPSEEEIVSSNGTKPPTKLLRDHDHLTGAFRGPACARCNCKARIPKQIIAYFHNLESYDGHELVLAIAKLRGDDPAVQTAYEEALERLNSMEDNNDDELSDDDDDDDLSELSDVEMPDADVDYAALPFSIIANTKERYMQITFGPVVFRDSFRFNATSLGKWIDSQRDAKPKLAQSFPLLSALHPFADGTDETLDLLLQKVPMAFSRLTGPEYFDLPALLDREDYYDVLREEDFSEAKYRIVENVVDHFDLQDQGDYHDLYLYTDALALADCMESMRTQWDNRFGLDMVHSVTLASGSFQAMLNKTNAKVKLVTEECGGRDFMDVVNKNIRGGVSCIFQPYAKANNWMILPAELPEDLQEYASLHDSVRNRHFLARVPKTSVDELLPARYKRWMQENGYNPEEPTSWIVYVDANSLYPTVMQMSLPYNSYQEIDLATTTAARLEQLELDMENYRGNQRTSMFLEVTYHVPESLHDFFDFAPVAKRKIHVSELSPYQRELMEASGAKRQPREKLFPFLGEHREVLHHIELLQYMMQLGVKVTEVHRAWRFAHKPWVRDYVVEMSQARAESKNTVDKQIIKIMMNSLYGKFCQDKLKQRSFKPHTDRARWAKACGRAEDFDIVNEDPFFALTAPKRRKGPVLDTPRPAAFTILELSKLVVLKAHYNFFRQMFVGDRCQQPLHRHGLAMLPDPVGESLRAAARRQPERRPLRPDLSDP